MLTPDTVERIKNETIAALRHATQHQIDTGKLKHMLSEQQDRILKELLPFAQKVESHDAKLREHGSFLARLKGFLGKS